MAGPPAGKGGLHYEHTRKSRLCPKEKQVMPKGKAGRPELKQTNGYSSAKSGAGGNRKDVLLQSRLGLHDMVQY